MPVPQPSKQSSEGKRERERDRQRQRERERERERAFHSSPMPHNTCGANGPGGLTRPPSPGKEEGGGAVKVKERAKRGFRSGSCEGF